MTALLVSDREREYTVGLLRGHWLSGRLTAEEFEERVAETWRARYAEELWQALRWLPLEAPPAAPRSSNGPAVSAAVLAVLGLCLLAFTFGFGSPIALPMFVTAWALGREARRSPATSARGAARVGEVLGVVGTTTCLLLLASCAAVLA